MTTTSTEVEPDADWDRMKNFITAGTVIQTSTGQIMRVTKVNPKNYVSMDTNGQLWNIRRTPNIQRAKRQDSWNGPVPENAYSSDFKLGSPVRLKNPKLVNEYGSGIHIVIAITSDNTFRIAKLDGTARNSYLHRLSTLDLELVKGTFIEEN